jgi:glutathione S-transferase
MIRLYRFPYSANVERVAIALAHKGLEIESVNIDPEDRSEVRRVSGQDLVPVIDDDGTIVSDSTDIIRYLDEKYPEAPLFPKNQPLRSETEIFIDWFNRVWKRPPNEIYSEMRKDSPDQTRIDRLGRAMTAYLDWFEGLLQARDYLMGDFSAADCAAFPFLRYALICSGDDTDLFHKILVDWQPLGQDHPRLASWIRRVDERPRA